MNEPEFEIHDHYSNAATIIANIYEIQIQFGLESTVGENQKVLEKMIRMRMSPQHAKSVSLLLQRAISEYEKAHSEIFLPPDLMERLTVDGTEQRK